MLIVCYFKAELHRNPFMIDNEHAWKQQKKSILRYLSWYMLCLSKEQIQNSVDVGTLQWNLRSISANASRRREKLINYSNLMAL